MQKNASSGDRKRSLPISHRLAYGWRYRRGTACAEGLIALWTTSACQDEQMRALVESMLSQPAIRDDTAFLDGFGEAWRQLGMRDALCSRVRAEKFGSADYNAGWLCTMAERENSGWGHGHLADAVMRLAGNGRAPVEAVQYAEVA